LGIGRKGEGTQFRIIGGLQTGDAVEIISLGDGWTQVRTSDGTEGWVSAGFLEPEPPAVVELENLKGHTEKLQDEVAALNEEVAALTGSNEELAAKDDGQNNDIDRLTRENYELRAGARWPEWITGGAIVLLGMALGAILSRSSGRRQKRIRL
jgi:SH3 domain protein